MQSNRIFDFPEWSVTSYGNGLAYALENKAEARSVLFQGDDATRFMREVTALVEGRPALDWSDAFSVMWNDYSEVAEDVRSPDTTVSEPDGFSKEDYEMIAEARHNFPALCTRNKRFAKFVEENEKTP